MGLSGTNPSYGYYGQIGSLVFAAKAVVNKEGKDFGLKKAFYADGLKLIINQTDSMSIGIYESTEKTAERLEKALEAGVAKKFDTFEALASSYGIDEAEFKRTAETKDIKTGLFYGIVIKLLLIDRGKVRIFFDRFEIATVFCARIEDSVLHYQLLSRHARNALYKRIGFRHTVRIFIEIYRHKGEKVDELARNGFHFRFSVHAVMRISEHNDISPLVSFKRGDADVG